MHLGCNLLWGDGLDSFRRTVRLAADHGFDVITVADSPIGWHELYISLSLVAQEVQGPIIGTMVTGPFVRHPVVNAGAISALHEITDGRAIFGIGRGGTLVSGIGRRPADQKEILDYLLAMRDLLGGESIRWEGRFVERMRYVHKVPIYYAAVGPKALRMAGEVADGVIIFTGPDRIVIEAKVATVRAAAASADRNPKAIDTWIACHCAIEDGNAWREPFAARDEHHMHLDGRLRQSFRGNAFQGTRSEFQEFVHDLKGLGVSCLLVLLSVTPDPAGMVRSISNAFYDR